MKIDHPDSPFDIYISFEPLVKNIQCKADQNIADEKESSLLIEVKQHPLLIQGFKDLQEFNKSAPIIDRLVSPLFPSFLTHNEIKAITMPYTDFFFRHTERFKAILAQAGKNFYLDIRNQDIYGSYIPWCCIILNEHYKAQLDFSRPLFYQIPDLAGNYKTYRILYNVDFIDITPTEDARKLHDKEIVQLIDNYEDLDLWKRMFPPKSYRLSGFAIINLFDVTVESAISTFKENFVGSSTSHLITQTEAIVNTIFKTSNMRCGLLLYKKDEHKLYAANFSERFPSFFSIDQHNGVSADDIFSNEVNTALFVRLTNFTISSLSTTYTANHFSFKDQYKRGSFLLAPILYEKEPIAILEIYCPVEYVLNSINAQKLEIFLSYLAETIHRIITMHQNKIQALIQTHYTSIHKSVYWKFHEVIERHIQKETSEEVDSIESVIFNNVYALYGQVDIQGSSDARNKSIQYDLQRQLQAVHTLVSMICRAEKRHIENYSLIKKTMDFIKEVQYNFNVNTEQTVFRFLEETIHPWFRQLDLPLSIRAHILDYFKEIEVSGTFHRNRQAYALAVNIINNTLIKLLDKHQQEAQKAIPHYFERYKTDGIDFSLYVGHEISPQSGFKPKHLHNLRYWQLSVLVSMISAVQKIRSTLPCPLGVTGLILVYHTPLSIRFRMDEKKFDIDGTYNVRYEVIKKRIDKAHVKGRQQRIVEEGKITVVYNSEHEKDEYLNYVEELCKEKGMRGEVSFFDVEDLQSVVGLKALQISLP